MDMGEEYTINRSRRRMSRNNDAKTKRRRESAKQETERLSQERRRDGPPKCFKCGRKLRTTNYFTCRCGEMFCSIHRFYDQHNCSFNFKDIGIRRLKDENPQVVNKKVTEF